MKFRLAFVAALFSVSAPLTARAQQQPWLSDRRYSEGIGVRAGNLELHPGVAGEVGYDSNYFLRAPGELGGVISAIRLRITPSITLSTLTPQRATAVPGAGAPSDVSFRAGAFAAYNELFATDSKYSDDVSKQRHVDLGANFKLDLFRQAHAGLDTYLDYLRLVEPSNTVSTQNAFDRDSLRWGAGATWRPGGGRFQWRAGYELGYNYFEKQPFRDLNNVQHSAKVTGRWVFLPRTALLYDGAYTWLRYTHAAAPQGDGEFVRSRIGLNGLITTHFSLLGMIGWGATFFRPTNATQARQFDSLTGQVELKWFLTPQAELSPESAPVGLSWVYLGYVREFSTSYLGDFYQRDRGYAGLSYFLGGIVVTGLDGGVARVAFPDSSGPGSGFTETRVDAKLFAEYRLGDTFGINTTIGYDQNITDKQFQAGNGAPDPLKYSRFYAFLGARWFM